jgi:hypothetical protein
MTLKNARVARIGIVSIALRIGRNSQNCVRNAKHNSKAMNSIGTLKVN